MDADKTCSFYPMCRTCTCGIPDEPPITKEQAEEAMRIVNAYLDQQHGQWMVKGDEREGYCKDTEYVVDAPPHHDKARQWARELLSQAEVETLCGCPLCQS